jgi:hypothetical protein
MDAPLVVALAPPAVGQKPVVDRQPDERHGS